MALISGTGGYISVAANRVDVTDWTLNAADRLAEGTTSANTSSSFESTLGDNSWTVNMPLDDADLVSAAGLTPGAKITLWLKNGTLATFHRLVGTSVASVGFSNPNTGDLQRLQISGQGGVLTLYAAGPPA